MNEYISKILAEYTKASLDCIGFEKIIQDVSVYKTMCESPTGANVYANFANSWGITELFNPDEARQVAKNLFYRLMHTDWSEFD